MLWYAEQSGRDGTHPCPAFIAARHAAGYRVLVIPPKRFDKRWRRRQLSVAKARAASNAQSPLTGPTEALLRSWLTERTGLPADPLFPTRGGRRLSRDAIALRVSTHAATAATRCPSLEGKPIHPHVFRHTCAMSLLQAGVDTSVIALWLGHAGVRSTAWWMPLVCSVAGARI